ncbi:MAG: hypothetical protein R2705_22560 [Ilumatobacteraceae bacterium]
MTLPGTVFGDHFYIAVSTEGDGGSPDVMSDYASADFSITAAADVLTDAVLQTGDTVATIAAADLSAESGEAYEVNLVPTPRSGRSRPAPTSPPSPR